MYIKKDGIIYVILIYFIGYPIYIAFATVQFIYMFLIAQIFIIPWCMADAIAKNEAFSD